MAVLKRAQKGDTVELMIMEHYGRQSDELLRLVMTHERNKHLCAPDAPFVLDSSVLVYFPDAPNQEAPRFVTPAISLWS